MHVIAKHLSERCVKKVRRGVIPLGVETCASWNGRASGTQRDYAFCFADGSDASIHLSHLIHLYVPAVTAYHAGVRDLSAGLRVERSLTQHHCHATVGERGVVEHLRVGLGAVVADEDNVARATRLSNGALRLPAAIPCIGLPCGAGELVGRNTDFFRLALLLRLRPLRIERLLEPDDVNRITPLSCHQLGEIDRESESI